MQKDRQPNIADSNIASYGGKDHQSAKDAKAQAEKEYKGCGQKPGVEIWRIENKHNDFGVKKWPEKQYGTFYQGDCYIILYTYKDPKNKKKLLYNAHFWLGQDSTQDEQGTAAYKVVELDDLLGDLPVQYREVQGHESNEFMDIFDSHIKILKGGIDSGFNHVEAENYTHRLLQCKGKKTRVTEVAMSRASLNAGDVFVLDAGLVVIQWNGAESSAYEKRKGGEVVNSIKGDRPKAVSRVIDADEDDDVFWEKLGGKGAIAAATSDEDVKDPEPVMYRVTDKKQREVGRGVKNIKRNLLDSSDVFILDLGHKVYVWVGKKATKEERGNGIKFATQHLKESNRPLHTPICRIAETAEPDGFMSQLTGPAGGKSSTGFKLRCAVM